MTQIAVEDAEKQLARLIDQVNAGEDVVLTENDVPVARLVPLAGANGADAPRPRFGSGKGEILYMAPDFDAELEDFEEYMP